MNETSERTEFLVISRGQWDPALSRDEIQGAIDRFYVWIEQMVVDEASSTVHTDWNIRSLSVHPGDRWQICARPRFRDPCIILTRNVPDATMIGIEGQIGSARPAPEPTAAPAGN